jgi:hypothetical protein
MKVIFLDFDGVLNSAASFSMEERIPKDQRTFPVMESLCRVCASNFQIILDEVPDAKVVISSTWREHFDLDWIRAKLSSYGIDSSKVIDKTPVYAVGCRGDEIQEWLDDHPEVTEFVIIDDNWIGRDFDMKGKVVATEWMTGLLLQQAFEAVYKLGVDFNHFKYI